ncbi:MAG: ankyrin repeat domain-containing protein, partial [SAR324 cluster bacterium]|nr:ankyrin repeat domain-containing protein [SAR324 cluster bacterium]
QQNNGSNYQTILKVDKLDPSSRSGSIIYPDLACGGSLWSMGTANQDLIFREKIEYGKQRCVDGGKIRLSRISPEKLIWEWYNKKGIYGVGATLKKLSLKQNNAPGPDIIYRRLGIGSEPVYDHYRDRYLKRLRKMGLSEADLSDDRHAPTVRITKKEIVDRFVHLTFQLSDHKYNLLRYNLYVNGVPQLGGYGKEVSGHKQKITERIELADGLNKIEISVINQMAATNHPDIIDYLIQVGAWVNDIDKFGNTALMLGTINNHKETVSALLKHGAKTNILNSEGKTALMLATSNGYNEIVDELIQNGVDVNAGNKQSWSPLMEAAVKNNVPATRLLLQNGAALEKRSKWGSTALVEAAYNSNFQMVKLLIDHGANVNTQTNQGWNALMWVARGNSLRAIKPYKAEDYIETAKLLLDSGILINQKNKKGDTALMIAIIENRKEMVQFLLERKSDVNAGNMENWTPLMEVANHCNAHIATALIKHGAALDAKSQNGSTALIEAVYIGCNKIVQNLLEAGADANIKMNEGWTALMHSTKGAESTTPEKQLANARLLIKAGAHLNLKNDSDETALVLAYENERRKLARLLIESGADLSGKNFLGTPLLQMTMEQNDLDTFLCLLENGFDIHKKDNEGETALLDAIDIKRPNMARLLLEKGADVNVQNNEGWTALMKAAEGGQSQIVDILLAFKANLEIVNTRQETALSVAVIADQSRIVQKLLQAGANLEHVDSVEATALMYAAHQGKTETLKVLLQAGARVNQVTKVNQSALMAAAQNGYTEIVDLLVKQNANVFGMDWFGNNALSLAAGRQNKQICDLLIGQNPEINHLPLMDNTCLMGCRIDGFKKLIYLGDVLYYQKKSDGAEQRFNDALKIAESVISLDTNISNRLAMIAHGRLVKANYSVERFPEAQRHQMQRVDLLKMLTKEGLYSQNYLAERIAWLAWYHLLNKKPADAIKISTEALKMAPNLKWIEAIHAHGYLLNGNVEMARKLYLENSSVVIGKTPWFDYIQYDFVELRKYGIHHPAMVDIERQFQTIKIKKTQERQEETELELLPVETELKPSGDILNLPQLPDYNPQHYPLRTWE